MSNGRVFVELEDEAITEMLNAYIVKLQERAASIVDPESGKHVPILLRRGSGKNWSFHTRGSIAFARALEQQLGLGHGEVRGMEDPGRKTRLLYLAHASEDKNIAGPLAEGLLKRGVEVWYDGWEIGYGDSLRRKMEQGLGNCTHFIVLLTHTSIKKPWVNEEIDAGLMNAVEGTAKFIGLRHDLPLSKVSPFLKTRLTPEFTLGEESLDALAAEIYGVSKKPPAGEAPRYVHLHEVGSIWSSSATVVAEYFVRRSMNAGLRDPHATYEDIQHETSLPMADVRIGVLDLIGAGLLEKEEYIGGLVDICPRQDLFVTFDAKFMAWDPEIDARDLAVRMLNMNDGRIDAGETAQALDWEPRRFNAAAAYLVAARIVEPIEYMGGGNYWPPAFGVGDELLRFVKSL